MPDFPAGLSLRRIKYIEVGENDFETRVSNPGLMVQPFTVGVPAGTEAVVLSFRTVDVFFGTPDAVKARSLSRVYFEVTEEDFSELQQGTFTFKIRALLRSDTDVTWTPHLVLQLLCFG